MDSLVVKSHGGTGFSNSLDVCCKIIKGNLIEKLKEYLIMRINLTKKDLVNLIYMQLGFSKQISEKLIFQTIIENLNKEKTLKISKFEHFQLDKKNQD